MIGNFTEIKPLCYWVQHVLPLVYDDSLSYMELLDRVAKRLNELIENNNKLPDYIMELIKEYISSGEIEKVLAEVLANYMLNVKFPPAGLTPATGDGSADDTEAIQGCINYAFNNGGMSVYFPSGSYLTQPLTLRNKATLFGQDRYTTRLVMKGGATTAMFTGDVDELTLSGLGFDGNMDIQINNVNLFTISVNSAIISNCLLTDGYDLLNITVNNDLQLNNLLFRHAVENALVLNGAGIVQGENLIFKSVSTLVGKNFVVMGVSKSILEQVKCFGASPNGVLITGNNNVIKMWNEQSLTAYVDNGTNNSITVYTQSEVEKLTGSKTAIIGGNVTETITGNKGVSAHDITETATGTRTENTTGNRNETTGGNATETITGNREVSSQNYDETVRANKVTNANKSTENVATEKDLNANVSRETLVTKTVSVSGVNTENSGSKNETITGDKTVKAANSTETIDGDKTVKAANSTETIDGDKTVKAANSTETIDGDKTVNAGDISNTAANITNHATQDLTEKVDGVRTLNVAGANNETTSARTETVNGNKSIKVTGVFDEDIDGKKTETYSQLETTATNGETHRGLQIRILTEQPMQYSKPVELENKSKYFNYLSMFDVDGNSYNLLAMNDYTNLIMQENGSYNIVNYGAKANVDITTILQNVINMCPAHGLVYIPWLGDKYILSSTITIDKPLTLLSNYYGYEFGDGAPINAIPLFNYTGNDVVFNITSYGTRIIGLSVAANNSTGFKFSYSTGAAPFPRFTVIQDCVIDKGDVGYNFTDAFRTIIKNCMAYNCNNGFLANTNTSLTFINCWARNITETAYNLVNSSYSSLINCAADTIRGDFAYYFQGCYSIGMINCGCEVSDKRAVGAISCSGFNFSFHCQQNCAAVTESSSIFIDGESYGVLNGVSDSNVYSNTNKNIIISSQSAVCVIGSKLKTINYNGVDYTYDGAFWNSKNPS